MIAFSEIDIVRSVVQNSFADFVKEFWTCVSTEELVWNWHMQYLCDETQVLMERIFRREPAKYDLLVNVPPGSSKSTIFSVMLPIWAWTRKPTFRSLCGSYAFDLGMNLSKLSRDIIIEDRKDGGPNFCECFPEIKLSEEQNTKGHFANTQGGWRYSCTVGKSPIGFHGHLAIIDDPLNREQAESQEGIKNANDWVNKTMPSRKVNLSICPTIMIMQRLGQDDPSGNWLKHRRKKVKLVSLPADCHEYEVIPNELAEKYTDGLLDPVRFPRNILKEIRSTLGQYSYAGQYGQSPIPKEGAIFSVGRISIEANLPTSWKKYPVRYWDKAGTKGDGAYSVGVKMGIDNFGKIWILHVERGQWDSADRERVIEETAKRDTRKVRIGIEQEPGSGGKESASNTIRRLLGFVVQKDLPTGDKVVRADPFSTQVNDGNVVLFRGEWNDEYIEELKYFPKGRYKDQVDASAGAFKMLTSGRRIGGGF